MEPKSDSPPEPAVKPAAMPSPPLRSIPKSELKSHATKDDIWIAISGDVYDVTPWLPHHPGGDLPLLTLAGQDATDAFIAYHPSSVRPLLKRFLIGRLSDYTVSPASADYRRLLSKFSSAGFFDRPALLGKAHLAMMLILVAAVLSLVFLTDGFLPHLLAGCLLGFLWIQSGWMGHDSGHHPILANHFLNRALQVLSGNCLTGVSIAWWKRNHNTHHLACNSLDHDPDVQHMPFFAVSGDLFSNLWSTFYDRVMVFDCATRFLISYQHFTFYPVMCFARINLFAQSIIYLTSKRSVPHRYQELIGISVFWIWYPLLVSCLPNWSERIAFVLASFMITGIQHVQFCLNHFSSDVYIGPPGGTDWFEKQTAGTLDITAPACMDWFHGGLHFQIEHHLFPRMPRQHLRKVAPFVRELCKKHGLPYAATTFWEANVLTVKTLRAAALQARKAGGGGGKNLLWEAVNTHG